MYGMMAKIPFRGMVKSSALEIMEKMYGPHAADPGFDPMNDAEEGTVMRLVKEYGGKAAELLGRAEKIRDRLPFVARKRRK
jgi:hypothetical protein